MLVICFNFADEISSSQDLLDIEISSRQVIAVAALIYNWIDSQRKPVSIFWEKF